MTYRLAAQTGDAIPVPQLIFRSLNRASGDYMRVALYILATQSTDPHEIAASLGLKNAAAAQKALDFWHGVGLLEVQQPSVAPKVKVVSSSSEDFAPSRADALRDPMVGMLVTEAQSCLGRSLGQVDLHRLISLYITEGIPVDVILLCATHIAAQGQHSVTQLERELDRWTQAGVHTGQQAEDYLVFLQHQNRQISEIATLLQLDVSQLNTTDKRCIIRWLNEFGYNQAMIQEAVLRGNGSREIKYINGILKNWYGRGWRTVSDIRASTGMDGSNARVDRSTPSGNDILQHPRRRPLRLKREV